jgi:chromosomal replication initiator protein
MATNNRAKLFEDDMRALGATDELINFVARNFIPVKNIALNSERIRKIKMIVSDYTGMFYDEEDDLFEIDMDTRKRDVVQERQKAMFMALRFTRLSLAMIGSMCGGRDHATVLHAEKTVKALFESDPAYARDLKIMDLKIAESVGRLQRPRV